MEEQRQKNCSKPNASRQQPRNSVWKTFAVLSGLVVVIAVATGVFIYSSGWGSAPPQTDYATLVDDWSRPDGDYTICIRGLDSDGKVQAAYFNPNPIHVAQATVSSQNNVIKLFIELRDVGYPGSKYDMVYIPENDVLQGTYFQARDKELYDVVFVRKNNELKPMY